MTVRLLIIVFGVGMVIFLMGHSLGKADLKYAKSEAKSAVCPALGEQLNKACVKSQPYTNECENAFIAAAKARCWDE